MEAAIGIGKVITNDELQDISKAFCESYNEYIHTLNDNEDCFFFGEITAQTDNYIDITNRHWLQNADFRIFWEDFCAELNNARLEPDLILMARYN